MQTTYRGRCHCGAVAFEADLDLSQPSFRCNCTICRRTRFWPAVTTAAGFRLLAGRDALTEYRFGSRKNVHYFCRHCGVRTFGHGTDTPVGEMFGVNLGCIDELDDDALSRVPITYVDGLHDRFAPPSHTSHL